MGIGRFKGLNLIMSKRYRGIFIQKLNNMKERQYSCTFWGQSLQLLHILPKIHKTWFSNHLITTLSCQIVEILITMKLGKEFNSIKRRWSHWLEMDHRWMLVECSRKKQVVVSLLNDHTLFFLLMLPAWLPFYQHYNKQ